MGLKEDVIEMKKEVENIKEKNSAIKKKEIVNVPYIVFEKDMEHKNSIIKMLFSIIICLTIVIGVSIYMFMVLINSFDFTTYNQDGNGLNNINTGTQTQGDVINESTIENCH